MNKRCRIDGIMRIAITCAILSLGLLVALGGCGAGADKKPVPFSQLPLAQQRLIVEKVAPPALAQRDNPYSTPMYYLPAKGYQAGPGSMKREGTIILDRNRPDIQEQLLSLPLIEGGRNEIHLRQLQSIAAVADWRKQRRLCSKILFSIPKMA